MLKEFKVRLIRHINFLETELMDYEKFSSFTKADYFTDRDKRRNVERWIENIIQSSIDAAKIILTVENLQLPDTYKEIVSSLGLVPGFDKEEIEKLSEWVRLRNILIHEYLDIKWNFINRFIVETEQLYKNFLEKVKVYIQNKKIE